MNPAAARLIARVIGWQFAFTLGTILLLAALAPHFLLLSGSVATEGIETLSEGVAVGGLLGIIRSAWRLRRLRFALRALAVGSAAVEAHELLEMSEEPKQVLAGWSVPSLLCALVSTTLFRPKLVDLTTGVTLCLLGAVIVAAAALPLFGLLRSAFSQALELSPPDKMRDVVEDAEKRGLIVERVSRRMIVAVTTPVAFLTLGAALIVSAHLRRADERSREETARVLARASLEERPGPVAGAGLDAALEQGRVLGFEAQVREYSQGYAVTRGEDGMVTVVTPLDDGSAEVKFLGSTQGVLGLAFLGIALMMTALAGWLGTMLGSALGRDLRAATRDIRDLGTEAVLSGGTRVVRAARFRMVARLGRAIEQLAQRFRIFAKAQERSIEARQAAARMRGLFFASVSHDLKSPLNAILGFTELVRNTDLSPGQVESLDMIEARGRELLALIETILDAARVEAGQLSLLLDAAEVPALLEGASMKGIDLASSPEVVIMPSWDDNLPLVRVDPVRIPRALATFVAHALRSTTDGELHVHGSAVPGGVRIDIELPRPDPDLEALLKPNPRRAETQHRGLALGLRLARSVVELHGGTVEIGERGGVPAVSVLLPEMPGAS
ncbi:MAG TPA: HAMP domain-containing sensor histidine kinase [Polyangiaceae bacterium]|nr:HAMP domain-containing sensor histidine kinase [Polyangiaceae bacterium]